MKKLVPNGAAKRLNDRPATTVPNDGRKPLPQEAEPVRATRAARFLPIEPLMNTRDVAFVSGEQDQTVRLRRHADPQKRHPVLIENHKLGTDIFNGMAYIIDDDALQERAFGFLEVSAGALDDHFARQFLKILYLRKRFDPHRPSVRHSPPPIGTAIQGLS